MTTFTTQDRIHAEKDGSFTIDCRLKPLTDDQIIELCKMIGLDFGSFYIHEFARAIERAHGIR